MTDLRLFEADNPLLEEWYRRENILVRDIGNGDKCYIFFSSNDIYYPNTVEAFMDRIVSAGRYEWVNISSSVNITKQAGRFIFVRDLYKQWYITGASEFLNSHDSLIEYLRGLSEGYRVITVGSSAGGYMAALVGALLDAEACFDFSGQVVLKDLKEDFCVRMTGRKPQDLKYYDIRPVMKNSRCVFYYFYPAYNPEDVEVYNSIRHFDNVFGFGFAQKEHAATMIAGNMRFIVCRNKQYMARLYSRYKERVIGVIPFFFHTAPVSMWIPIGIREVRAYIKRHFYGRS